MATRKQETDTNALLPSIPIPTLSMPIDATEPQPTKQRRKRSDAGQPRTERRIQKGLLDPLEIAVRELPKAIEQLKAYEAIKRRVDMYTTTIRMFGSAEQKNQFDLGES